MIKRSISRAIRCRARSIDGAAYRRLAWRHPILSNKLARDAPTFSVIYSRLQHTSSKNASSEMEQVKQCPFCSATNSYAAASCASCASPALIPEQVSYFDLFPGIQAPPEGTFAIDVRNLRREFLKLQQQVHPDHFSNEEKKRTVAESTSSRLNKAYSTLLQPLSRAEYILSLRGIEMSSEGESLTDGEVLMTVMELREQIEEAGEEDELTPVKDQARELIETELSNIARLFAESNWSEAKTSAIRLRYWENILKAAVDWEPGAPIRVEH